MIKSRVSHRHHKYPKDSLGKEHLTKKHAHSRSPMKASSSLRTSSMKHLSSGMKSGHLSKKSSHPSRLRSITSSPHRSLSHHTKPESPVSVDRSHSVKGIKYEKRKHMSISPVRRGSSSHRSSLSRRSPNETSYQGERYQTYNSPTHSPRYVSPTMKKPRSEDRYYGGRGDSLSPHRGHANVPAVAKNHSSRSLVPLVLEQGHHRNPSTHAERSKHSYDNMRRRESMSPVMSSSRSKAIPSRVPYPDKKRYRSSSPDGQYTPAKKSYAPTLHERFSSVIETSRSEPRVRYSREDLEKITIDIRRNVRDPSPTPIPPRAVNPPNVKFVHRASESQRPAFDREEIKKVPRDLREDTYYTKVPSTSGTYSTVRGQSVRNADGYEVPRQFDYSHDPYTASSSRTLNERWQSSEPRKSMVLHEDGRDKYQQFSVPTNYSEIRSHSRSGERDFQSDRYAASHKTLPSRSEYDDPHLVNSSRSSTMPLRKGNISVDVRQKLTMGRSESQSLRSPPVSKSHYSYSGGYDSESMSVSKEMPKWNQYRSQSRERLDDFPVKSDKYSYKGWADKSEPKESTYYERSESVYSRGTRRPFRSLRGSRGSSFRGVSRGVSGSYRGVSGSYRGFSSRGRGMSRR